MIFEKKKINYPDFFLLLFPIDESYYLSTNKPCNLQLGLHLQCQLYLSSIVKYGFVRDIPGRSENAVPMVYRHARRRSLLKVAVCQPLGLRDIILARASSSHRQRDSKSTRFQNIPEMKKQSKIILNFGCILNVCSSI